MNSSSNKNVNQESEFLAAMDLGSARTRVLVAEVPPGEESRLRFAALGEVESKGWRKGAVIDLDAVTDSVRAAVMQAEAQAGVPLESAVVGIGGAHIQGVTSRAGLPLAAKPREITRDDVRRVMEAARGLPLPDDREVLHMLPQEFALDNQTGVRDPIGMHGRSLAVQVHLVTGSVAASQGVVTAVNRAGLIVETVVAEAFAVGEAVLTQEERELGSLVALLGGGSTEFAAYSQGSLWMSAGIPVGGDHFTNDIAIGLHTPTPEAENIKLMFGSVYADWSHDGVSFEVPGLGNRPARMVPRQTLHDILAPRAQEVFGLAADELRRADLPPHLGAGLVLAGGGARLHGLCDLAEHTFSSPARIGLPSEALTQDGLPPNLLDLPDVLNTPEYTVSVALLLYAYRLRSHRAARERTASKSWRNVLGRKAREGVR
jgi:cell division protein FtsA